MASLVAVTRRQGSSFTLAPHRLLHLSRNSIISHSSGKSTCLLARYNKSRALLASCSRSALFSTLPCWLETACSPHRSSDVTENQSSILAVSPATALDEKKEIRIIQRLLHRLRQWWRTLWESTLVALRSAEVALYMSPLLILTPLSLLEGKISPEKEEHQISEFAWNYTIKSIQNLGPCFVKLAQWIATRRDIFPPTLCDRFSQLHDRGFAHKWHYTEQALKEAFGNYEEKGLIVNKDDIVGCGSAAQVYKATLETVDAEGSTERRPVAVKVLHPRFLNMVERDFQFMNAIAHVLHALPSETLRVLNLPEVAENFGVILRRQADLRVEGENLKQFRDNFQGSNLESSLVNSSIFFPLPCEGWVDREVLVEDLVQDCKPISAYLQDSSKEGWEIRKELAGPLLRAFLKMVFLDNFVHCDLHAGNVLVHSRQVRVPSSSSWWSSEPKKETLETKRTIVFLDAGIATSLSPNERKNLRDLFRAVILNDGKRAGRLMVERAKTERCSTIEGGVEAFSAGVESIVSDFHDGRREGLTLGAVKIGSLLSRVLDLCRIHGVGVDPAMSSIVVSTLVLEGLGRSLEPDLNLIDCAVPFVLGRGRA